MIFPSQAVRIVIATKPVDFRKGHDGLAAVAEHELGLDPHSGVIDMELGPSNVSEVRLKISVQAGGWESVTEYESSVNDGV